MAGFCETEYGCTGRLTLNGVPMHNPAFVTPLLSRLWFDREYRGENVVSPGLDGRRSNPRRYDEVQIAIPIYINGLVNVAGDVYADAFDGVQDNIEFITNRITHPRAYGKDPSRGTMLAFLETPGGSVLTGQVKAELELPDEIDPTYVVGTLTITLPDGEFIATGAGLPPAPPPPPPPPPPPIFETPDNPPPESETPPSPPVPPPPLVTVPVSGRIDYGDFTDQLAGDFFQNSLSGDGMLSTAFVITHSTKSSQVPTTAWESNLFVGQRVGKLSGPHLASVVLEDYTISPTCHTTPTGCRSIGSPTPPCNGSGSWGYVAPPHRHLVRRSTCRCRMCSKR